MKALFDYQRFEKNAGLAKLILQTESRYDRELSDEDLSLVNAAGDAEISGGIIFNGGGQLTSNDEPTFMNGYSDKGPDGEGRFPPGKN